MSESIAYTGGRLDRAAPFRKDDAWVAKQRARADARVAPSWKDRIFVRRGADGALAPVLLDAAMARAAVSSPPDEWLLLGIDDEGAPVFAAEVTEPAAAAIAVAMPGTEIVELRRVSDALAPDDAAMLAYARGMLIWQRRSRHCGGCGAPMALREAGHARVCATEDCNTATYPRTDPAVIMLVERDAPGEPPACLLAHHGRLAPGMFSTLAGFVEPGESLEEAVIREVLEETGVRVTAPRYVASQPWPFPASLMLGFRAVATTTAIVVDAEEIAEARWFTVDALRAAGEWGDEGEGLKLPRKDSIARQLIEGWIADNTPQT